MSYVFYTIDKKLSFCFAYNNNKVKGDADYGTDNIQRSEEKSDQTTLS